MIEPKNVAVATPKDKVHKFSELAIKIYETAFKKKATAIYQCKTFAVSPKNFFTNKGPNAAPSPRAE